NWTQRPVSSGKIVHVTYGGSIFLAGGMGILTSRDGDSWAASLSGARALGGIAYGNYMFLAASGAAAVYTSTNALTWTGRTIPGFELSLRDMAFGNGQFVAAGGFHGSGLLTSTDGIAWRGVKSSGGIVSVSCAAGVFVAVGHPRKVMTSLDATTWITTDPGT